MNSTKQALSFLTTISHNNIIKEQPSNHHFKGTPGYFEERKNLLSLIHTLQFKNNKINIIRE